MTVIDICKEFNPATDWHSDSIIVCEIQGKKILILNQQENIYTSVKDRVEFLSTISKLREETSIYIEIPYFIKNFENGLRSFLSGGFINTSEASISFNKTPADFNLHGLQDFVRFLNNLKINQSSIIDYPSAKLSILECIQNKYNGHIELVLPKYCMQYEKQFNSNACQEIIQKKI